MTTRGRVGVAVLLVASCCVRVVWPLVPGKEARGRRRAPRGRRRGACTSAAAAAREGGGWGEKASFPEGRGWIDLSGDGRCLKRPLVILPGGAPRAEPLGPPHEGAVCNVLWTAWLAESEGGLWRRGERVGLQQANASLEFTVGGGATEATKSWDLAVVTMVPGERCEILATSEYAFGEAGAEPHIPQRARMVFELELTNWTDWANGRETVIGMDRVDDEEFSPESIRSDLEARRSRGEVTPIDDLEDRRAQIIEDAVLAASPPPVVSSGNGEGCRWGETETEVELKFDLDEKIGAISDVVVRFGSTRVEVDVRGRTVIDRQLRGSVAAEDCSWALSEDRRTLELLLEKKKKKKKNNNNNNNNNNNTNTNGFSTAGLWTSPFAEPPHQQQQSRNL